MKILILGAGWYGCHLATYLLNRGHTITITDKSNKIFSGSSFKNQNRLHLGFHYPRSKDTIQECQEGFRQFVNVYPHLIRRVDQNIYFIASHGSHINLEEYIHIMNDIQYTVLSSKDTELPLSIQHVEDRCLQVDEMFIDPRKARDHFEMILQPYMVTGDQPESEYDYILDCTYNQRNPIEFDTYELYITLLYSIPSPTSFAYTIMDGNYFSIYPYDIINHIYTLTSVKHGILLKTRAIRDDDIHIAEDIVRERKTIIEHEIKNFIPDWDLHATYVGHYVSWKTKPVTTTDDRSLRISVSGKIITMYGGKITGIFHAENKLQQQFGL